MLKKIFIDSLIVVVIGASFSIMCKSEMPVVSEKICTMYPNSLDHAECVKQWDGVWSVITPEQFEERANEVVHQGMDDLGLVPGDLQHPNN